MPLPELKQLDVTTPLLQAYQIKMMQGKEERDLQRFGLEQKRFGLEEKRLGMAEEEQTLTKEKALMSIINNTLSAAVLTEDDAGSQAIIDQGEAIAKRIDPRADFSKFRGLKRKGNMVEQPIGELGVLKGPAGEVSAALSIYGEKQYKGKDLDNFMVDIAKKGVTFERPKEKPLEERVAEKKVLSAIETPKTAMEAFLKQKPNATPDEIAVFSQKLKGKIATLTLPDGTVIEIGGAGGDMTPKTKGSIEESLLQSQDSMGRLKKIETTFNRDYLNIGKRIGFAITGWQEKLKGTPVESIVGNAAPKEVAEAEKYWVWRQDSVANLNKEIKWLTGAAMNKEEVPRLQQEVPNPGLGIFDGDAPSQFESKLRNKLSQTKSYIARYNMYLKQGVSPDKIKDMGNKGMLMSENQIKQKINEKAKILEKAGMDKAGIINQLEKEFFTIRAE